MGTVLAMSHGKGTCGLKFSIVISDLFEQLEFERIP